MIYLFDQMQLFDETLLERTLRIMPPARAEQTRRYLFVPSKRNSAIAWLLLAQAVRQEYGLLLQEDFCFAPGGKPYLSGYPKLHFNLSHCNKAVACAISSAPIGLDVEQIQPVKDSVLRFVCNAEEIAQVQQAPNPQIAFCQLWTQKESLLKLSGEGLRRELPGLLQQTDEVEFFSHVYAEKGYALSCCAKKGELPYATSAFCRII